MNYQGYIIYGWEELTEKIIDEDWLINNNIKIYNLEVYNIKPRRIIYGLICDFCSNTGKVLIDDNNKNIVTTAFTKILQNNIKLEYFIGLDPDIDYYNYYNKYNPDQHNPELESNYTDTDVPDNNTNINFDSSDSDK